MNIAQQFSPKEIAQALGVSEATIKRWVDKGKIPAEKTLGGHRKINLKDLKTFCDATKYSIKVPEVLGLTANTGRQKDKISIAKAELNDAFKACSEEQIRGLLMNLYLADVPLESIFDDVLAPALHQLGCDWESGSIDAFQERRVIQICTRLLYSFDAFFHPAEKGAGIALFGTLRGDQYIIPILMCEALLRSKGLKTEMLGNDLEVKSYTQALKLYKPEILCLSISADIPEEELVESLKELKEACERYNTRLIVGGSHVTYSLKKALGNIDFMKSMTELAGKV